MELRQTDHRFKVNGNKLFSGMKMTFSVCCHLVDCKKRLFEDDNDTNDQEDDEIIAIKQRNSVKKRKVVCA